jgi:hypothetical protein
MLERSLSSEIIKQTGIVGHIHGERSGFRGRDGLDDPEIPAYLPHRFLSFSTDYKL